MVDVLLGNSFPSRGWLGWQSFGGSMPVTSGVVLPAAADRKSSQKAIDITAAVPMVGYQIEGSSIGNKIVSSITSPRRR